MISVIIPVYNSEKYLRNCLDSVLAQTYSDIEVICIDDGSTDSSGQILDEYSMKDERVKVIHQINSGVSHARNVGIANAQGDYIGFIDSDDEIEADMYDCLLGVMKKYHADISHCGYKKIHLNHSEKDVGGTNILLTQNRREAIECLLSGAYFTGGMCNKLYRTDLVKNTKVDENLRINEDVLFNVQAFLQSQTIVFYDVPKYHYFERDNSSCIRVDMQSKLRDCVQASSIIYDDCKDTECKNAAACRLYNMLCALYRNLILSDSKITDLEVRTLAGKIKSIRAECENRSVREKINGGLILHCPHLYKVIFQVYERMRKPNWDV